MRRGHRHRRLFAVAAGGSVLAAAIVGMLAWRHDRHPTGSYLTDFSLVGAETSADLSRIRQQRRLVIGVADGICMGTDERPPKERFERVEFRATRSEVVGSVRMQANKGEFCAGVGEGFRTTVELQRPIGSRALISYRPYNFRFILIPPTGRAAARRLVLPIRRDRRQPPPLIYTQPACDLVAKYLTDVPKRDWCQY